MITYNSMIADKNGVLIIDHSPVVGGAERYIIDLVRHVKDRGGRIAIATASDDFMHEISEMKIPAERFCSNRLKGNLAKGIWNALKTILELKRLVVRKKVDVIQTNTVRMHIIGVAIALLARKKLIWTIHSYDFNKMLFAILAIVPEKIIFVSKSIKESYVGNSQLKKYEIIYNGIDEDVVKNVSLKSSTICSSKKKIGIMGRIEREKGHLEFIQSFEAVLRELPDAQFYIIGQPNPQQKDFEFEIRALLDKKEIKDKVHFMGYVKNPFEILAMLDVIVQPSRIDESFGRVLMEAMAVGTPVIATSVNGFTEIVQDGINGVLVPVRNPVAIAQAVIKVLTNVAFTAGLVQEGKKKVMAEYNVLRSAEKYAALLGI